MRARWALGVGLGALLLVGCERTRPLMNAQPSAQALGEAVVRAVAANDRGALRALAVDEQEFRQHVWPALPAARPERNLPFSYVWRDLQQKSGQSLGATLAALRGRPLTLVAIRFDGGTTAYSSYVVHRESVLTVRDAQGQTDLRIFGSALEKDGVWKVFSYVVDDR